MGGYNDNMKRNEWMCQCCGLEILQDGKGDQLLLCANEGMMQRVKDFAEANIRKFRDLTVEGEKELRAKQANIIQNLETLCKQLPSNHLGLGYSHVRKFEVGAWNFLVSAGQKRLFKEFLQDVGRTLSKFPGVTDEQKKIIATSMQGKDMERSADYCKKAAEKLPSIMLKQFEQEEQGKILSGQDIISCLIEEAQDLVHILIQKPKDFNAAQKCIGIEIMKMLDNSATAWKNKTEWTSDEYKQQVLTVKCECLLADHCSHFLPYTDNLKKMFQDRFAALVSSISWGDSMPMLYVIQPLLKSYDAHGTYIKLDEMQKKNFEKHEKKPIQKNNNDLGKEKQKNTKTKKAAQKKP